MMKVSKYVWLLATMIVASACNSGKNSTVDSHPSSGAFKPGADKMEESKQTKPADTARKDKDSVAKK